MSKKLDQVVANAKSALDQRAVEMTRLHFDPKLGAPFWLEKAKSFDFNPLTDVKCFDDIKKFPLFEDDWLRGGPVRRWIPEGVARRTRRTSSRPAAPPASRRAACVVEDHWIDYEEFSRHAADDKFSHGVATG